MEDKVVKFVRLIESYPCLYNHSLPEYARKDILKKTWANIAREMNWTVADCKEKWKNIRNGFVRNLKSLKNHSVKKPYYLRQQLQFILPYVRPMQSVNDTSNFNRKSAAIPEIDVTHSDETTEDANDRSEAAQEIPKIEASSAMLPTQKRVHSDVVEQRGKKFKTSGDIDEALCSFLRNKEKQQKVDDHQKMFILSLLPEVKQLNDTNLRSFKIRTMTLIDELLTNQNSVLNLEKTNNSNVYSTRSSPVVFEAHTSNTSDTSQHSAISIITDTKDTILPTFQFSNERYN